MSYSITKRYTQALFNLSQETKKLDAVYQDLKKIKELINKSKELESFLSNPTITTAQRKNICSKIFKSKIDQLTFKFINFLEHKNRLDYLKNICNAFEATYLDAKNVLKVQIISSVALSKPQVREIQKLFGARLNKDIETEVDVDPTLLGGIKIQDGDTVYDYSIATQLEKFRRKLVKA